MAQHANLQLQEIVTFLGAGSHTNCSTSNSALSLRSGKAARDGSHPWDLALREGDQEEDPVCWFQISSALAFVTICGVNQHREDLYLFSLCKSALQTKISKW